MSVLLFLLCSYLIGCFMTGNLVAYFSGVNLLNHGSGNIGARNAGRVLGKMGFIVTFIGDAAKGALAIGGAILLGYDEVFQLFALICVISGHIWPILYRFRGGKGISSLVGGLAVFNVLLLLMIVIIFVVLFIFLKSFSFTGLISFLFSPFLSYLLYQNSFIFWILFLNIGIVFYAHRENVVEIIHVKEKSL
ncbi:glycerol-3-phosphate acyltransferase [Salipaludibacillus sp. CF4.18]|uniref:glycerol-3-phosphate acyltransferase n=1 Tax=Salipaludibacillus sp. CF4.18 TaxID=3373081 RepID=UPI003EE6C034